MRYHVAFGYTHNRTGREDRVCGFSAEITADSPIQAIGKAQRLIEDVTSEKPINVECTEVPPDDADESMRDLDNPIARRLRLG